MPEIPPHRDSRPALPGPESAGVDTSHSAPPSSDVFLSYNSRDLPLVHEVAEGLDRAGLRPFLDRWDLAPGLRWRPELERALASCRAVAVFVGPHGIGEVQDREVGVALHRQDAEDGFRVIPVLLPGGQPPGGFLEGLTWIDLRHQSVEEGVGELARAVRGEGGAGASRRRMRATRNRYLVNLGLLLLVVVAATAWYFRHLHARLAHVAVGGSVALLTLLRLVIGYARWGAESELRHLSQRILGAGRSTPILLAALAVAVVALAVTSSVHLEATVTPGTDPRFRVQLRANDARTLWEPATLTREHPRTSKWFFWRFATPVQFHLDPVGDRAALPARLGPASRLVVRVPDDFPARQVDVLRILPGTRLIQILGKPGIAVNRPASLAIRHASGVVHVEDLRKQAMYWASSSEDLAMGLAQEGETTRQARLEHWARATLGLPEDRVPAFVRVWAETPRTIEAPVPEAGLETLAFELTLAGDSAATRLTGKVLDATNNVRTLLIEREP